MILTRDVEIVQKLAELCADNPVDLRFKHVAALVDKNKILSLGMNKTKSDPGFFRLSKDHMKKYIHAEYDCLNNIEEDCSRYTMYVVRVGMNGKLAQSRPCSICEKALRKANVGRIVHTITDGIEELKY